jgi:ADYC domain
MKRPTLLSPLLVLLAACPGAAPTAPTESLGEVDDELSMNNGPGLGMNGPGLGMNGPALGQTYTSFGAKQAAVGLAYVRLTGAQTTDGAAFRSLTLVKGELRGTLQNGTIVSGTNVAGAVLRARGLTANGAVATGLAGERTVRVEGAIGVEPGAPLQDGDFYHYAVRVQDPTTGAFVDPCDGGYAVALPGRWDNRQGVTGGGKYLVSDNAFTFACQSTAVQKCAEAAHYKPWEKILGPLPPQCDPVVSGSCTRAWTLAGADALQSCVRLVRGDFCGDGTPLTFDGTRIDGNDNYADYGIEPDVAENPDWPIEARWNPQGATCIDQTRVTSAINGYIEGHCRERVANCVLGEVQQKFDDRTEPVLLNRSKRKMSLYLPTVPQTGAVYGNSIAAYVDAARKQQLVAIGAVGTNEARGAVHLFRVSTSASAPATLGAREYIGTFAAPPTLSVGARFGMSLAFVTGAVGPDLFVGAPQHNDSDGLVVRLPFESWDAAGRPTFGAPALIVSPEPTGRLFGWAMASTPAGRLFVSARDTPCGGSAAGAVFVLEPGDPTLRPLLGGACPSVVPARFGWWLRALGEEDVLVGAIDERVPLAGCPGGEPNDGALHAFRRQADGSYQERWVVRDPDCRPTDGFGNNEFGWQAEVSGGRLFVAAPFATVAGVPAAGKVHVYDLAPDGVPMARDTLTAPALLPNLLFGESLATYTADGTRLAIMSEHAGGHLHFYRDAGDAYELTGSLSDPLLPEGEMSALGVTLNASPPFLFIGSPFSADSGQPNAGVMFHFQFDDQQPTPLP